MKIAFTICNRHHLSHALVLGASLQKHNPNHAFFIGLVDRMELPELPNWVTVVPIKSLELADLEGMAQRYYDFELVAACKLFFARHLLASFPDCQELVFLSPTTQLFGSLEAIADKSAFLQLSPQRLRPIPPIRGRPMSRLDDKRILNTGMYQAGSWIMHPDGQEAALLDWWCERMTDRGYLDLCTGMCLDQLWLNYLPIYHERVKTIRNPGWNYGLPAVPGSYFALTNGKYLVDGNPLITLDFAGLEGHHPIWSDHSSLIKGRPLWPDLRSSYRSLLREHEFPKNEASNPYGKLAPLKSYRHSRNLAVRWLNSLTARIEAFDWTYN